MNKQEAIEEIKKQSTQAYDDFAIIRDTAISIINQINELERPVVPKYVADFISSEQRSCSTLSEAIDNMDDERQILNWFYINPETFAKAWIYGYEVEKEKLYTVELPSPNRADVSLVLGLYNDGKVAIFAVFADSWKYEKQYKLTEAEIKKEFDWAWQFAKKVEE